jgi:hypothetical protein
MDLDKSACVNRFQEVLDNGQPFRNRIREGLPTTRPECRVGCALREPIAHPECGWKDGDRGGLAERKK